MEYRRSVIIRGRNKLDPHPESRFDKLRCIGIDETSYRKGHTYMTVVVNHDTGDVIWLGDGHDEETLSGFFKLLTRKQRASIKYIAADGASWIQSCVKKYCPRAKRCLDPLHVVSWSNDALSQITAEFLLSYILPLFAFDLTQWDEVVKFFDLLPHFWLFMHSA